jgi:endonuclease YncB( thermonuclease family)
MSKPPPIGLTTDAIVTKVIDGDTLEVEISRKVRVRLLDCWAPESRGEDSSLGKAAREHLRQMVTGHSVVCQFPASPDGEVQDIFTFGRVLGRVWRAKDGVNLSEQMVKDGFACKEKPTR